MDNIKLEAVVRYIWKNYFHKSCNFYCNKAVMGTNSFYIVHKGYPNIRISDHVVHPDNFNYRHIYVDILSDEMFINGKLVITKYTNNTKYLQLLLELFELEMYLFMVNWHRRFLTQWHSKRRKPLYYENIKNCKGKILIYT